MRYSNILLLVAIVSLILFSCSQVDDNQSDFSTSPVLSKKSSTNNENETNNPGICVIGASMTVAWPFLNDDMANWTGDEGTRTSGGWGYYCGSYRWSHSGAEYYARDLNRSGGDYGRNVYAGFAGEVILAGSDGCYGNCVVIYDEGRHVALRYAHLSSIGVSVGNMISARNYIGKVGDSGCATGSHLHIVGYENINDNYGNPIIPTVCDSDFFSCIIYFTY